MITELAYLEIDPLEAKAFEEAVGKARPYFEADGGCLGMQLSRVIETPGRYILQVEWKSVEAHMVDFRQSDNFQQWRQLVGDFFVTAPKVEHVESHVFF